jgi:hypothetical protein
MPLRGCLELVSYLVCVVESSDSSYQAHSYPLNSSGFPLLFKRVPLRGCLMLVCAVKLLKLLIVNILFLGLKGD